MYLEWTGLLDVNFVAGRAGGGAGQWRGAGGVRTSVGVLCHPVRRLHF